jgi:hypothetical protein
MRAQPKGCFFRAPYPRATVYNLSTGSGGAPAKAVLLPERENLLAMYPDLYPDRKIRSQEVKIFS